MLFYLLEPYSGAFICEATSYITIEISRFDTKTSITCNPL